MKNILLIDSGSGGINILAECVKVCPYGNYLLFCDANNLPYGNKSKKELIDITEKNLKCIKTFFNYDIVILACNTLTATVLDEMREKFPNVIFIGTVPAIKPALLCYKPSEVLVIATKATIEHNKLVAKYKKDGLNLLELNDLASLIDENLDNLDILKDYLKVNFPNNFKAIVLGCTHYSAVKQLIKEILPKVDIFESANGVARRLLTFAKEEVEGYQIQIFCQKEYCLGKFWWYYEKINTMQ